MGRRRQHNGDLALSSDQIPGLGQNNIRPGLVTLSAGLARPFANRQRMLLQTAKKGKLATDPAGASKPVARKTAGG